MRTLDFFRLVYGLVIFAEKCGGQFAQTTKAWIEIRAFIVFQITN